MCARWRIAPVRRTLAIGKRRKFKGMGEKSRARASKNEEEEIRARAWKKKARVRRATSSGASTSWASGHPPSGRLFPRGPGDHSTAAAIGESLARPWSDVRAEDSAADDVYREREQAVGLRARAYALSPRQLPQWTIEGREPLVSRIRLLSRPDSNTRTLTKRTV